MSNDHKQGRRISALRSGLTSARERFDELIGELQDAPFPVAQIAMDARDDVQTALERDKRIEKGSE
jgi:hypothetical protein